MTEGSVDSRSAPLDITRLMKGYLLPALAAGIPLAAAIVAGLVTDSGGGGLVGIIERFSSSSSSLLRETGLGLGLGIAFAAGMVSTVNPCGFPMLPAYLAMYLGSNEEEGAQASAVSRLGRALTIGGVLTAGFILLFGTAGLVIGGGATAVVDAIPWVGLGIGVVLAITGGWMLGGGKLYSGLATRAASRMGDPTRVSIRGYFLFGLGYATASLSCTLPIFLAVTGISLASSSFFDTLGQFFFYGLGMGFVITLLTLAIALFKGAMVGVLRQIIPYVQPISAGFMILAGAYIVFYWLTIGGVLD